MATTPRKRAPMTYEKMTADFAERLDALRIAMNWTTDEMAREIGTKPGTFRRWTRGECQPPLEAIYEIRKATDCSLNWLIAGDGAMAVRED